MRNFVTDPTIERIGIFIIGIGKVFVFADFLGNFICDILFGFIRKSACFALLHFSNNFGLDISDYLINYGIVFIVLFNAGLGVNVCFLLIGERQRRLSGNYLFFLFFRINFDHITGFENRIPALSFSNNFIKFIVSGQINGIDDLISGAFSVWQTQTASDGLLPQNFGSGST